MIGSSNTSLHDVRMGFVAFADGAHETIRVHCDSGMQPEYAQQKQYQSYMCHLFFIGKVISKISNDYNMDVMLNVDATAV